MKVKTNKEKRAYVSPATACVSVNYNICAGSSKGSVSAGTADYGGELTPTN